MTTSPDRADSPTADAARTACRQCGEPLSEARATLGLSLCSVACGAVARRVASSPTADAAREVLAVPHGRGCPAASDVPCNCQWSAPPALARFRLALDSEQAIEAAAMALWAAWRNVTGTGVRGLWLGLPEERRDYWLRQARTFRFALVAHADREASS